MRDPCIRKVIVCHPKDNVATVISAIKTGTSIIFPNGKKIIARDEIPFAHKIALRNIRKGNPVIKYGERIGKATHEIGPGEWVHIHNVAGERGKGREK